MWRFFDFVSRRFWHDFFDTTRVASESVVVWPSHKESTTKALFHLSVSNWPACFDPNFAFVARFEGSLLYPWQRTYRAIFMAQHRWLWWRSIFCSESDIMGSRMNAYPSGARFIDGIWLVENTRRACPLQANKHRIIGQLISDGHCQYYSFHNNTIQPRFLWTNDWIDCLAYPGFTIVPPHIICLHFSYAGRSPKHLTPFLSILLLGRVADVLVNVHWENFPIVPGLTWDRLWRWGT